MKGGRKEEHPLMLGRSPRKSGSFAKIEGSAETTAGRVPSLFVQKRYRGRKEKERRKGSAESSKRPSKKLEEVV